MKECVRGVAIACRTRSDGSAAAFQRMGNVGSFHLHETLILSLFINIVPINIFSEVPPYLTLAD